MEYIEKQTSHQLIELLVNNQDISKAQYAFADHAEVSRYNLTEKNDIFHIAMSNDSVLYVQKGKLVICDLDIEDFHNDKFLMKDRVFLLGAGEPYHKKPGRNLMLFACKDECEFILWNFKKSQHGTYSIPLDVIDAKAKEFKDIAKDTDDYYFGYDERYARVYEAGADLWESDQPNESLIAILSQHQYLTKGQIIDLGCGEGRDTIYLAKQGFNITGVDVSRVALNKARDKARSFNLTNLKFIESDVVYLRNIKNDSYDFAMNMGCLHMLTDPAQRANHLRRTFEILKSNGCFLVDHCQNNWGKGFYSIPDYDRVAKDLVPGKHIPRRIRVDGGEKEINLKVLPFSEKQADELIAEICAHGFTVIDTKTSDTEAFGNSSVLLFRKE